MAEDHPPDRGAVSPVASELDTHPEAGARGDAVARLAGILATLATAGDIEGARALHETIGRLLGAAPARGEGAPIVDLEAERRRRAGR